METAARRAFESAEAVVIGLLVTTPSSRFHDTRLFGARLRRTRKAECAALAPRARTLRATTAGISLCVWPCSAVAERGSPRARPVARPKVGRTARTEAYCRRHEYGPGPFARDVAADTARDKWPSSDASPRGFSAGAHRQSGPDLPPARGVPTPYRRSRSCWS